jgi:hypothetical protein
MLGNGLGPDKGESIPLLTKLQANANQTERPTLSSSSAKACPSVAAAEHREGNCLRSDPGAPCRACCQEDCWENSLIWTDCVCSTALCCLPIALVASGCALFEGYGCFDCWSMSDSSEAPLDEDAGLLQPCTGDVLDGHTSNSCTEARIDPSVIGAEQPITEPSSRHEEPCVAGMEQAGSRC